MMLLKKYKTYKNILYFISVFFIWNIFINIAVVNDYQLIFEEKVELNPFSEINHFDNLVGIWNYILLKVDFLYLYVNNVENGNNGLFVSLIYTVTFLCFISQALITFKLEPTFLKKIDKDKLIEFNLNIPPFLGVIGTVFTFTTFLSNQGNADDMLELFKLNFNLAALTTILGGITYSVNFFLYMIYVQDKKAIKKRYIDNKTNRLNYKK